MEIPKEYSRVGESWEKIENEQLIKEYTIDNLNILDICKIHKRMPGGIISRLKHLGIISDKRKNNKLINSDKTKIEPTIVNSQSRELIDMRNEIVDLKKDVKEMLRLMNALYEFEIENREE